MVREKELIGQSRTISKERIRSQAEVFTGAEQVSAMLDLVRDCSDNIDSRFLEPSCGNGNFLVAVLHRKMVMVAARHRKQADFEFYTLVALSSIYGVDINDENVSQCRDRLKTHIVDWYSDKLNTKKPNNGFYRSVDHILKTNILVGDMINAQQLISFVEYSSPKPYKFKERVFRLVDLLGGQNGDSLFNSKGKAKPVLEYPLKGYLELGDV